MTHYKARRRYFIDHSFQSRFILKFCLIAVISSCLFGAVVYIFSRNSTTVAIENTRVFVKPTSDFILPILWMTIPVVAACSAIAVAIVTLYLSHRIAGPAYRLNQEINRMKQGRFDQPLSIRRTDQLQLLAANVSELAGIIRNRHTELKRKFQELDHFFQKNQQQMSTQDTERIQQLLQDLKEKLDFFTP